MRTFKNNTEDLTASDNTEKKRMRTNINFARDAVLNSCTKNNNFVVRNETKNSKNVKQISHFRDYSYFLDLNKAKTLPVCGISDNNFYLSLCDASFNVETGNNLNDILNTMVFDASNQRIVNNFAFVPGEPLAAGDISGANVIDESDANFSQYFIDPSGTLFNNNCSSDNNYLGLVRERDRIVRYDLSLNPISEPNVVPYDNKYYKNRLNNVKLHSGVYFNN